MVTRYDILPELSCMHFYEDGDYVLYKDYAALESRLADLEMELGDTESDFNAAVQHNMELQSQIAELEKDAARYRWLKSCQGSYDSPASVTWNMGFDWVVVAGEVLESSIDDAMSREA